jgi:hypothetical protein
MASHELQPPSPKKKKTNKYPPLAPTTISALSDDLLHEIFLRLPSLPTLARAAFACGTFLDAVRSCPAFRRHFRALHSPPLLGLFINIYETATPAFSPLRRRSDPDLAAAVRGADFFLTRLPVDDMDAVPNWSVEDCREGCVLLVNWTTNQMAAYNPLTGSLDLFPAPPEEVCEDVYTDCHILSYEEDRRYFRILSIIHEEWGACALVFSSDTRKWQVFPWYEDDKDWPQFGTLVNGFIYSTLAGRDHARVLDTTTMEFSQIDLPSLIQGRESFRVGETKDGKLCLVCVGVLNLIVWVWRADEFGVNRWMLDKTFLLKTIAEASQGSLEEHDAFKVVAIVDGCVYLSTFDAATHASPCLFLSFCMETSEVNTLCPSLFHPNVSRPYIMAWPSSLVRNKVNPQLNAA